MRISTSQVFQQGLNSIQTQMREMGDTQQQISTGKRVLNPSDDPVAASRILGLDESIARTEQFQRNIDAAEQQLNLQESTLASAQDVVLAIRDVGLKANSEHYADLPRKALTDQFSQLQKNLMDLANSQDGNGNYLFAGDEGGTRPFTLTENTGSWDTVNYVGGDDGRSIRASENREVTVVESGEGIFKDVLQAVSDLRELNDEGNSQFKPSDIGATLQALDKGMDKLIEARSRVGSRLEAVEEMRTDHREQMVQYEEARSQVRDVDLAEAITNLNQQNLGLQAAQQSFAKIQGLSLFNYIS